MTECVWTNLIRDNSINMKSNKTRRKRGKPVESAEVFEDELSHQACYLPSPHTQLQTTFRYDTDRHNFRSIMIEIFKCCCPEFNESDSIDEEESLSLLHINAGPSKNTNEPIKDCPTRTAFHTAISRIRYVLLIISVWFVDLCLHKAVSPCCPYVC